MSLLERAGRIPGVNRLAVVKKAVQERADVAAAHEAELRLGVRSTQWATTVTEALRFAADPMIRFRERVHNEGAVTLATIDDRPFFSVRSAQTPGNPDRVQLDITLPDDYPHIHPISDETPADEITSPTVIKFDAVGSRLTRYKDLGFRVAGNNTGTIRTVDGRPIARVSDSLYEVLRNLYQEAPEIMERAQAVPGSSLSAEAFPPATPPQR